LILSGNRCSNRCHIGYLNCSNFFANYFLVQPQCVCVISERRVLQNRKCARPSKSEVEKKDRSLTEIATGIEICSITIDQNFYYHNTT